MKNIISVYELKKLINEFDHEKITLSRFAEILNEKGAELSKNRYLLFAGGNYHPAGGFTDLLGGYPSIEKAIQAFPDHQFPSGSHWAEICDVNTLSTVKYWRNQQWVDPIHCLVCGDEINRDEIIDGLYPTREYCSIHCYDKHQADD
jgi:hypothetical protein